MPRCPVVNIAIVLAAEALLGTIYSTGQTATLTPVGVFAVGTKAFPPVIQALLMDLFSD